MIAPNTEQKAEDELLNVDLTSGGSSSVPWPKPECGGADVDEWQANFLLLLVQVPVQVQWCRHPIVNWFLHYECVCSRRMRSSSSADLNSLIFKETLVRAAPQMCVGVCVKVSYYSKAVMCSLVICSLILQSLDHPPDIDRQVWISALGIIWVTAHVMSISSWEPRRRSRESLLKLLSVLLLYV